ncbi:MAG: diguanylate cyclase, partial [Candidatus Lambdaproteobacteria bacterium]|nr:diguanylate cyclase [Candidatus Lambdaproteobacteria bacterium]
AKLRETSQRAKLYEDAVMEAREIASSHAELESEIDDKLQEILLYSKVIESSGDAVVITDMQQHVMRSNPAAVQMFNPLRNHRRKQAKSTTILELVKDFELGEFDAAAVDNGWRGEWSSRNKKKDLTLQVTVSPIHGKNDALIGVSYQFRDISLQKAQDRAIQEKNAEIHRTLVDLEQTYQELQRSDRLKTETLTVISNELSPPIRKIINHATKLIQVAGESSVDVVQNHLAQIREQGNHLKAIADNINYLIDFQFDLATIGTSQVELQQLLHDVVGGLAKRAKARKIRVTLEHADEPLVLTGDADQFKVLFNLLLEQAIAVAQTGTRLRVDARSLDKSDQVRVDMYYTGPSLVALDATKDKGEGRLSLLVGLPMARKIISQYQGSLQFLGSAQKAHISVLLPRTQKEGEDRPNRVILFDEHEMDRLIVRGVIEHLWPGSVLLETSEPFEFLDNYDEFKPDLVIIDPSISEPGWNNHRIFAALVQSRRHVCPLLSVSGLYDDFAERTLAVERGVTDFLAKPYSIFDLRFKIKSLLQSHRKEESLYQNMDQAQKQAYTDGLTHLANRKHFDGFLETQIEYSRQTHKPCSLIMLDVDNFKHYNDTNGHQLGDEVLKGVARILAKSVRSSDLAARYGGEEFVVVLPETKKAMAAVIAEKVRRTVQETQFPKGNNQPLGFLSSSFGVAAFPEDGESGEALIKAADDCLYVAKEAGRNTVIVTPERGKAATG